MKRFNILTKYFRQIGIIFIFTFSVLSILFAITYSGRRDRHFGPELFATYLENNFYDFRFRHALKNKSPSPNMTLAKIDNQSLENIGRFPWGRSVWAEVMKRLQDHGAKVVAFDVLFPEDEKACEGDPDQEFANSIEEFKNNGGEVILPYTTTRNPQSAEQNFPEDLYLTILTNEGGNKNHLKLSIDRTNFPIQKLTQVMPYLGFIDQIEDFDGVFRNYQIYANLIAQSDLEGLNESEKSSFVQFFPSLGLSAYRLFTGDDVYLNATDPSGVMFMKTKKGNLIITPEGTMKIRYRGDRFAFNSFSIADLFNKDADQNKLRELIKDKVIFIGSTASGAHDLRHSPVDPTLPGIYFHMNILDMLLEGRFFKSDEHTLLWTLLFLLVGTIILLYVQTKKNALMDMGTLVCLLIFIYYIDHIYFINQGHQLKIFFVFFNLIFIYAWNTFIHFYVTSKEKAQIRGAFSRYVAPSIVNQMLANPEKLKVGGEKKKITVLFSDVRDFTSISEQLSATQLSASLNRYMGEMTDILFDTKGTLDKYIGDAIVGYWGAPLEIENQAYQGVLGAVTMIEALPAINEEFKQQNLPEFKVGIGLNTGECSVGNMGSDQIFSYTALGDHMNLGARLEGLCKFYGAQILISEFTYNDLEENQKSEFTFRELDKVRVKGKTEAVTIFEVLHRDHPFKQDPYSLEVWNECYQLYHNKEFERVLRNIGQLLEKHPLDKSSKRLKQSAEEFLNNPPPSDWDGVTTYKEK